MSRHRGLLLIVAVAAVLGAVVGEGHFTLFQIKLHILVNIICLFVQNYVMVSV